MASRPFVRLSVNQKFISVFLIVGVAAYYGLDSLGFEPQWR